MRTGSLTHRVGFRRRHLEQDCRVLWAEPALCTDDVEAPSAMSTRTQAILIVAIVILSLASCVAGRMHWDTAWLALGARDALEALAASVPQPIAHIAIRVCPALPPTTEERIRDTRAASMADSIMYREALATAAEARGWLVHWYDRERVFRDASAALGVEDIDALLRAMGKAVGSPWQARHKLAAAAAIAVKSS
jgi:hypothetical protein